MSGRDSGAKGICQKPLLASSLLKMVAPARSARVSSTFGIGCGSRRTFSLSGLRSTHILTSPDRFGTTTMPAHQSVGVSILEITPMHSMRSSSSFTFGLRGMGTLRGTYSECGSASSRSLIRYSSPIVPRPWNTRGNCFTTSGRATSVASILRTNRRS